MPEEINRILTDRISNILFCPTQSAIDNLKAEGYPFPTTNNQQLITKVGDVMQDGALFYKDLAIKPTLPNNQKLETKNYILCTIHRAENTDDPKRLKAIFEALNEISKEIQIVLPLHPRTKNILKTSDIVLSNNIIIIEPIGYLKMVYLIKNAKMIMTDSGGLQKEAFFFEKSCITLRDETEWVELVECGANSLVGANKEKIIQTYKNNSIFNVKNSTLNLYGGGNASENIIKKLLEYQC